MEEIKKKYICLHCFKQIPPCDKHSVCGGLGFFCGGLGDSGGHVNVVEKDFYEKNKKKFIENLT